MAKSQTITWQAEEYVIRDHHAGWYVGLAIAAITLSALAIYYRWFSFLVLIVVSTIAILVFNLRPPRKIKYALDQKGLTEGPVLHKYGDFKAFGIIKEGSHYSAILIPKKRFNLSVKVYFPENSGEAIVDALGSHLPMEEVKQDFLDKIVNFLRI